MCRNGRGSVILTIHVTKIYHRNDAVVFAVLLIYRSLKCLSDSGLDDPSVSCIDRIILLGSCLDCRRNEGISAGDVEAFLETCDIEDLDSDDLDRYTRMSSQDNHYRYYTSEENGRAQTCFQYNMYDVNDEGGDIYIAGVDGDAQGEEYVGIYYVTYTLDGETVSIGQQPPSER